MTNGIFLCFLNETHREQLRPPQKLRPLKKLHPSLHLLNIQHQALEVFAFGVIDVDRVIGGLM